MKNMVLSYKYFGVIQFFKLKITYCFHYTIWDPKNISAAYKMPAVFLGYAQGMYFKNRKVIQASILFGITSLSCATP